MTLMIGLGTSFFLEMSKKCWPRFHVRNSTIYYIYYSGHGILATTDI
jgi:hypothetical protein